MDRILEVINLHHTRQDAVTICLFCEGTYPYITGGVSSWIQDIISGMPEFDFIVYAILAEKPDEIKYKLPENVVAIYNSILSEKSGTKKAGKLSPEILEEIISFHDDMSKNQEISKFTDMAALVNKANLKSSSLLTDHSAWVYMTEMNQKHNPLYPFSDYFWTWKASHEYLLNLVSFAIPEADLYHTISTGYAGFLASLAKIKTGKPVLLTEHGLYDKEREIDLKRAQWVKGYQRDIWIHVFQNLSRIAYRFSDVIISLFDYNRQLQILNGAEPGKTVVIRNGIDVQKFLDNKTETREDFSIGFVGRVVPIKDVKNFIISAKILQERMKNFHIYIIGPTDEDRKYYAECLQLAQNLKLTDFITFTGRKNVLEYYKFLDLLVLTSIREAQPLVIIEAFLAGIPVVSTRVGNVPEMLDFDEHLLADPKDAQKIAENILFLAQNPEYRKKLVEKNRHKAISEYNKATLIETYKKLYFDHTSKVQVSSRTDGISEAG